MGKAKLHSALLNMLHGSCNSSKWFELKFMFFTRVAKVVTLRVEPG